VEGIKAQSDIQIETVKAQIATNDEVIRKYEADIGLWRAAYANAMERVRAAAQLYEVDAAIYRADISKSEAQANIAVAQEGIIEHNLDAQAEMALKALETNLNAFISVAKLKSDTALGGAGVSQARLAALTNSFSSVIQLAATGTTTYDQSTAPTS
jgi:hypothetical protein